MDQPLWLGHAWPHLGQKEIPGARHNRKIKAFFKDAGHPEISNDETAWCAAFVGACLERTGLKGTRSLMARSYLNWGVDAGNFKNPVGAVAVLSRGSNPALGHVGFLIGESPGKLWLLGGNQSDAVTIAPYKRSRLLGLRWAGGPLTAQNAQKPDAETFERALAHVLEMEGGFTDDPVDPGGPTNKGITLRVFAAWRKTPLNSRTRPALLADLKTIPIETAREIYISRYWQPASCAKFPPAIALMHFDAAVNHGVGTAIRMLQQAVGADIDGEVGPETQGNVNRKPQRETLKAYATIRRSRYRALKHFWRFGRGWLRRVEATLKQAEALMAQTKGRAPTPDIGEINHSRRSNDMPAAKDKIGGDGTKWWGRSITIWGAFMTAAAIIVPALAPFFGLQISADVIRQLGAETFSVIQAVIGLVGMVMTIFGRLRAKQTLVRQSFNLKL